MIKIYIDAGHGGNDPGAVGNGLREKDLTLDIAKRIKKYLDDNYTGHRVKLSRTGDKTLSLKQRTNDANRWGADYFLSIHINAGGGTGYEDYIYNGLSNSSKTAKIRDAIHNEINNVLKKYNITNRGKKKANFHVLRETKMPAMLSETLFIDTTKDAKLLKDDAFLKEIGIAHAKGIVKAFGLKRAGTSTTKENTSSNVSKSSKQSTSSAKTSTYKGNSIVEYLQSIGQPSSLNHRRKLAKQYGIKGYVGTAAQNLQLLRILRDGAKVKPTKPKKTISQMADEVIAGKHGNGHAQRQKWLGVDKVTYQKVRDEVYRRLK